MIKVRLHGTPEEVKRFADYLENLAPGVKILQRSDGYADRGKSSYVRVYMDVEYDEEIAVRVFKRLGKESKLNKSF